MNGSYSIHDEIPLLNRWLASLVFVLQHPFPESDLLKTVREKNVRFICRVLRRKLAKRGQTRGRVIEVERRRGLSAQEFVSQYLNRNLPVIFDGEAADWDCTRKWNMDFLKDRLGDRKLEVFESSGLIERHLDTTGGKDEPVVTEVVSGNEFVDDLKQGSNRYLRFHPLMETERFLIDDMNQTWLRKFRRTYFGVGYQTFIGPARRITPIHAGTTAFFYVMADGEKNWTLFSASSSALLHPRASGRVYNFTDVDIKNPDLSKYPGFELLSRYRCHLKKGDILFVPTWMWHEVENLTESWGVSYRMGSLRTFLRYPSYVFVRLFLSKPSFFKILYNLVIAKTGAQKNGTTIITPQLFND